MPTENRIVCNVQYEYLQFCVRLKKYTREAREMSQIRTGRGYFISDVNSSAFLSFDPFSDE